MKGFDPLTAFGPNSAEGYDERNIRGDEAEAVEFLASLIGGGDGRGRALELAIGTGRIAVPLAARGVRVDGIDSSPDMVAKLRAKPGGESFDVVMGDFADVPVPGSRSYELIYLVYNTLFNLLTQDDQVRCFENAAAHLDDDGVFVIETFVPTFLYRLAGDQYVDAERIEVDEVTLDVGRHDPLTQTLDESHVSLSPAGIVVRPIVTRYSWPSELDLMARLAGLRLKERWGGWRREPFTAESGNCVSVFWRT